MRLPALMPAPSFSTFGTVAIHLCGLLAAATPQTWLAPGGAHWAGVQHAERVLSIHNSSDPALRFFPVLDSSRPQAVGYAGLSAAAEHMPHVQQWDARALVGGHHRSRPYLDSPIIMRRVRDWLFAEDLLETF